MVESGPHLLGASSGTAWTREGHGPCNFGEYILQTWYCKFYAKREHKYGARQYNQDSKS